MRNGKEAAAHSVLNYIITRAVLHGKVGSTTLKLRLADLVDPLEGIELTEDAGQDIILRIKIETDWTTGDEEVVVTDMEEEEEEQESGN